jgi:predicted DNA-binding transcriptional regulator AlpA
VSRHLIARTERLRTFVDMTSTPLSTAPPVGRAWTREDLASYLQCSVRTVDEIRTEDPSFPRPTYIRPAMPRWRPTEVVAWFNGVTPAEQVGRPAGRRSGVTKPVPSPTRPRKA